VLGGDIAAEVARLKEHGGVIIACYEPAGPVRPGSYDLPEQP
jgi:hypothetical protein